MNDANGPSFNQIFTDLQLLQAHSIQLIYDTKGTEIAVCAPKDNIGLDMKDPSGLLYLNFALDPSCKKNRPAMYLKTDSSFWHRVRHLPEHSHFFVSSTFFFFPYHRLSFFIVCLFLSFSSPLYRFSLNGTLVMLFFHLYP